MARFSRSRYRNLCFKREFCIRDIDLGDRRVFILVDDVGMEDIIYREVKEGKKKIKVEN